MRKLLPFFVVFVILATYSLAGENKYLGRIQLLIDGGATTNASLPFGINLTPDGSIYNDGGYGPFVIPPGSKVTLFPDDGVGVLTDNTTCTYLSCLPIAGQQLFPSSVGSALANIATQADGGGIQPTALIVIKSLDAGGYGTAGVRVWQRAGNE